MTWTLQSSSTLPRCCPSPCLRGVYFPIWPPPHKKIWRGVDIVYILFCMVFNLGWGGTIYIAWKIYTTAPSQYQNSAKSRHYPENFPEFRSSHSLVFMVPSYRFMQGLYNIQCTLLIQCTLYWSHLTGLCKNYSVYTVLFPSYRLM